MSRNDNNDDNIRLTAIFQDNLSKPIPEHHHSGFYRGGGDNCSSIGCALCKGPVKSSLQSNQHPAFYRPDALPVAKQ